jgi:hypothetical protein
MDYLGTTDVSFLAYHDSSGAAYSCNQPFNLVVAVPPSQMPGSFVGYVRAYDCNSDSIADRFALLLNNSLSWSTLYPSPLSRLDVEGLSVHEWGHVHNLLHTNIEDDVMDSTGAFDPTGTSNLFIGRRVNFTSAVSAAEQFGPRASQSVYHWQSTNSSTWTSEGVVVHTANPWGPANGMSNRWSANCVDESANLATMWSNTEEQLIDVTATRTQFDGFASFRRTDWAYNPTNGLRNTEKNGVLLDPLTGLVLFGESLSMAVRGTQCPNFFDPTFNGQRPNFVWISFPTDDSQPTTSPMAYAQSRMAPSIAYDRVHNLDIIAWVNHRPGCSPYGNTDQHCQEVVLNGGAYKLYDGQILMATRDAGAPLEAPWKLTLDPTGVFFAIAGPAIACDFVGGSSDYRCVFSWTASDGYGTLRARSFTVDGSGAIAFGGTSVAIGYQTWNAPEVTWSTDGNYLVYWRSLSYDVRDTGNQAWYRILSMNSGSGALTLGTAGRINGVYMQHAPGSGADHASPRKDYFIVHD